MAFFSTVSINDFECSSCLKALNILTRSKRVASDVEIKSLLYLLFARASFQPGQNKFFKVFFYLYMSTLTYWLFLFPNFLYVCLRWCESVIRSVGVIISRI